MRAVRSLTVDVGSVLLEVTSHESVQSETIRIILNLSICIRAISQAFGAGATYIAYPRGKHWPVIGGENQLWSNKEDTKKLFNKTL